MRVLPLVLYFVAGAVCVSAHAANHHIIVCGSGGEDAYVRRFADWGVRLQDALVLRCGADAASVTLLLENGTGDRQSTVEGIRAAFKALESRCAADDTVWVYLIGHGSFRRDVSKLNIPSQDISAQDFNDLLGRLAAEHAVIVNAASSGAGFVNVLSGPGRVVCSATKDVDQRNATEFMEFFIQAIEAGGADQDRDERISILEACSHAAALTKAWYDGDHLIATENAILDDDGDGLGTRLPIAAEEGDGKLAGGLYLMDYAFPEGTTDEQIEHYRAALAAVEGLKSRKSELEQPAYYKEMEALLVQAARAHRAIRMPEVEKDQETPEPS